jgi:hypothetical protein
MHKFCSYTYTFGLDLSVDESTCKSGAITMTFRRKIVQNNTELTGPLWPLRGCQVCHWLLGGLPML